MAFSSRTASTYMTIIGSILLDSIAEHVVMLCCADHMVMLRC